MNKYKVMLVDDEKDVMDVIRQRIDWDAIGLEDPVYAANGLEALDLAEQVHPDIVMTDIKMPYMDGLELSRQLKQLYPNIRIIILSGFDEFEYAKEAVSLNAEEYLLKPIDAQQLQQVFTRIKNALDKEISDRQNQQMLENYYRQSLPVLQENFFASLVQGSIPPEEYQQYLHDYQISIPGPYYAAAVLYTSTTHVPKGMDYMLLFMSVRKLAQEKISSRWQPHYFNYLSHLCMVISLQKKEDITEFTDELDRFCRLAHSMVNAVVTAGIGQVCSSPSEISASYAGARQAVSYRVIYGSCQAINITEIAPSENEEATDTSDADLRELIKQISLEDPAKLKAAINKYFDANAGISSVITYNLFVMDLVGRLGRFARNNNLDTQEIFGKDAIDWQNLQSRDPDTVKTWTMNVCLDMQAKLHEKRSSSTRDFVEKAKAYVNEHYMDSDLSLNTLCHVLGVSGCYFSTVFKRETNQSFVSYLTDVRMNKAADLLVEQNEKAYIVATQVGYNDPNYFSYVFRRKFGVSPSKYKAGRQ
ncbi:MAG: response regulator [Lactimicrobium sp.]|jgi:two-component system response regulator YesN|uniref:response regulator n=1 Tax=Lactimicrobium sp. TaxID=2563780 RepID=UPI002F35AE94